MPQSISGAFQVLKENIEVSPPQKSVLATRQKNIRDKIELELEVLDSFLTGSYARHTLIAPLSSSDIDIFVVLAPKYYEQSGQTKLLDLTKSALLKGYTTPKISKNGQAITITFSDFIVDVVPAFFRNGEGYLIADSTKKQWIATNPKVHVDIISAANSTHNGMLVPIIKMIKRWNRHIDCKFTSFYLELLANNIFTGITISDFSSGMRYFFDKGRSNIGFTIQDPVSYGGQVGGFNNVKSVQEAKEIFEQAYKVSIDAEQFAKLGYIDLAAREWIKIFGNYFPVIN